MPRTRHRKASLHTSHTLRYHFNAGTRWPLCPHCFEGRAFRPASIRRISTTIPASKPGEVISFDPQKLPTTTLGGYTHMITMVDENTGHISQPGIRSKTTPAAFAGIQRIINQTYNANGHKVYTLHGDAERVNTSMSPLLGAIGAKLKVSLPGQHAHRAERTVQTIASRTSYPPKLTYYSNNPLVSPSTIAYAKLPTPSLPTRRSRGSNRSARPLDSAGVHWSFNLRTNAVPYPLPLASPSNRCR
jgi:hypothetical protein